MGNLFHITIRNYITFESVYGKKQERTLIKIYLNNKKHSEDDWLKSNNLIG